MLVRINHCSSVASWPDWASPQLLDKQHSHQSRTSESDNRKALRQGWQWQAADKVSWQVLDWGKARSSFPEQESTVRKWMLSQHTLGCSLLKMSKKRKYRAKMNWNKPKQNVQLLYCSGRLGTLTFLFFFSFFTMSISEEKNVILKKEYCGCSIGNCQQVKLNRMIQNILIPAWAFKEQNAAFTPVHNWANWAPDRRLLRAAVDDFGSLSTTSCRAHFNSYVPIKIHSPVLKFTFAT